MSAPAATRPTCAALTGVVTPGPFGFIRHTCHQQRGLRSFTDGRGETRWYCVAPGHQQSVAHRFGRAVATDDDYQPPACHFCHRTKPILDGTYTAIDFGRTLGIKHVCDDCYEKGNEQPDEWVQDRGAYSLVIDGGA